MNRLQLDPATYVAHALHRDAGRAWVETNCYADLWIEVLHALAAPPEAMLGVTLGIDFEGDQWTFFKPSHETLRALYGVQVEELTIWKDLRTHAALQTQRGRLVLTEADAFYLPDTAATDYKRQHTKTTIGIARLGNDACDYFHNGGYWRVTGDDLESLFAPRELPLFCEIVKLDHVRETGDLHARARELLAETLRYRPAVNPFIAFGAHLSGDQVTRHGLAEWHKYAFASLRQCGAAFELAAAHLRWLGEPFLAMAEPCVAISSSAKSLILKGARSANAKRALDAADAITIMQSAWATLMAELDKQVR